jgi:alpha-galactosidase
MLSQIGGTVGAPVDLGYSEVKHYKMPQPTDAAVASGLLTLTPPGRSPQSRAAGGGDAGRLSDTLLFGFTSSHRFIGRFYVRPASLDIIVDTEGLRLAPGESWKLEQFMFASGANRPVLLEALARQIARNHPPLRHATAPTGWCSWYCFGPRVTAKQVLDNLDTIADRIPRLRYVQIDDGYQPAMGDWLETGKAFAGDVTGVLEQIRTRGFEPAIWVAPFIAEADSHLFREHPDWFVKGDDGKPLPSDQVTFGGWRRGPWYALDGTHPEVQKHFEELFRTMREKWGTTYFKLDANFWGAMHGGHFHDPKATRIEAYRRGMEAIVRGAGDSFILGCNHPIWPSFGLIHGSRSSQDIKRDWKIIKRVAEQNLNRNWQNGRLWWNDPDAVVLTGDLTEDEVRFHATATYASGGMILSGDDLTQIPPDRLAMLQKLLPPTGAAATFEDDALRVGVMAQSDGRREYALFNWEDQPQTIVVTLPAPCTLTDVWTGESLGRHEGRFTASDMPPHSARLLTCKTN